MLYYRAFPEPGRTHTEETAACQELLLHALRKEYGLHTLPLILRAEHGKPYFPDYPEIHFNYSHTRSGIAVVVHTSPIGVDLEDIRPYRESVARHCLHPNEWNWLQTQPDPARGFIRIWTMKEAYLKYKGTGLTSELTDIDFSLLLEHGQNGTGPYKDGYQIVTELSHSFLCVHGDRSVSHPNFQIL